MTAYDQTELYRCAIVRGGTSKGIFIMENELPLDPVARDQVLLAIFGSPDIRQIDGLGGADVLTSKLAIIGPPGREDVDVDYTFGQVSLTEPFIDYGGNCGNISSAVGAFAIDMGLVRPVEPVTTVRIRMTNTDRVLSADVPVCGGKAAIDGDYHIDGVPGTGARVTMDWSDSVGGITGHLLPTGRTQDVIHAQGQDFTVSVVDAGNIVVFIRAESLGLSGTETPAQISGDAGLMALIEQIRGRVCVAIGLVESWEEAASRTPYQPFFAIVSPPASYECFTGDRVGASEVDLVSRLLFMLNLHKTYPITGTVATGAAARIPGTIVWELLGEQARTSPVLRIGHPAGTLPVEASSVQEGGHTRITRVGVYRTARILMEGLVHVRRAG